MTKYCKGCGARLQSEDRDALGYTPKADAALCQRCFRIRHYDDVMISMQQGIDPSQVLSKIAQQDALILWVVDLFDFEANLLPGIARHLPGKDIVLIGTKRDLLPQTLSDEKLGQFVLRRLKEEGIRVEGIVFCEHLAKAPHHPLNHSIEEVTHAIDRYRNGRDVIVMGMANAGKSTLLNALCADSDLTTSPHPGTTLDFVEISAEGYTIYDTPGITRQDSLLTHAPDALLKSVIPFRAIKPRVYQLYEDQSYALGGMVRLDVITKGDASVVAYFSDQLKIHRGKAAKADALWERHLGELLSPALDNDAKAMKRYDCRHRYEKLDVVIHGLGWFCVSGDFQEVRVWVNRNVNVTFRKAMI